MSRLLSAIVLLLVVLQPAVTTKAQSEQDPNRELLKGFLVEGWRANFVEGDVQRISSSKTVATLKANDTIEGGDTIQSGASGRAEILLFPGYYLRLDHDTRISFLDLASGNLKLKLWSGSAILEVANCEIMLMLMSDYLKPRIELSYEPVTFLTPGAEYFVATGGCYRFEADAQGDSHLKVLKGFAFVNGSRIDDGKAASVVSGKLETSDVAKRDDEFDTWSRTRAKNLVKANKTLSKTHWYKRVRSDRGYLLITDPEDATRAKERLTVSADTGVVALAENALTSGSKSPGLRKLKSGERLTNRDRVMTAVESRAEIHVFPNCFLLLAADTEIVYGEIEGRIAINLIKGSAIVILDPNPEATEPAVLTIVAGKVEHKISEKGNYRINLMPGGSAEWLVYDETTRVPLIETQKKAQRSDPFGMKLWPSLKKLNGDSFDVWSYRRSRLPTLRVFGRYFGPFGGMWYMVESTGEYTFVPARWEYSSPYGGSYSIRFAQDTMFQPPYIKRKADPLDPPPRPMRP